MPAHGRRNVACLTRIAIGAAVVFASALSSGAPAFANALTLQQTVTYALTHNSAIAAKQAALAQAESNYTKQHAAEFPPVVATLQNVLEKQNNYGGTLAQYGVAPIPNFRRTPPRSARSGPSITGR